MTKLTPAKRLKQLKANGWLEFVEFMEANGVTPRQVVTRSINGRIAIESYSSHKAFCWMADDLEFSLYDSPVGEAPKMMGLSEQVTPKSKKSNKMVKRGKYC